MKTFVIGDIHGCYDEFLQLLDNINPDWNEDKLVLVGDYIDRGMKSYETVKLVQHLRNIHGKDRVIALIGNHELMAIEYYETGNERWFRNGATATQASFEEHGEQVEDYLDFFRQLDYFYEDEHFIIVHAGIKPGISMLEQTEHDLVWIRDEFYMDLHASDKTVVFGHTPTRHIDSEASEGPMILNGNIAIDTGCVYGGALTAVELVNGEMVQVYQVKSNYAYKTS